MFASDDRHRVLIVDDDAPIRALLRLHLDLAGFAVRESGEDVRRST